MLMEDGHFYGFWAMSAGRGSGQAQAGGLRATVEQARSAGCATRAVDSRGECGAVYTPVEVTFDELVFAANL